MFDGILDFVGSDLAAVAVGSVVRARGRVEGSVLGLGSACLAVSCFALGSGPRFAAARQAPGAAPGILGPSRELSLSRASSPKRHRPRAQLKRSGHIAVHMTRQTSLVKLAWWGALNALKVGPSPRVNLLNGPNPMGELDRISAWIGEGKVKIPEVLRMPVAEAARAHELIAEEGDEGGRIVLTW